MTTKGVTDSLVAITGSLVVKTPCFQGRINELITGWGTKIPHATWCGKNKVKNADLENKLMVASVEGWEERVGKEFGINM